jgi:ferric-dicitrate binding protein FerR (iron transport regulator)
MMIPGQFEGTPRMAVAVAAPVPPMPALVTGPAAGGSPQHPQRRELPGWVKVAIFAATLLAVTWVVMWLDAALR